MSKENLSVDVEKLLMNISDITFTPISHITQTDDSLRIKSYPQIPLLEELVAHFPKDLTNATSTAKVAETEHQTMLYAMIKLKDGSFLILGPIIETALDNHSATKLIKKLNLPLSDVKSLLTYYDSTAHYTIYRFAKIAKFVCSFFQDDVPHTIDILPDAYNKKNIPLTSATVKPTNQDTTIVKTHKYERELYSYIFSGQYKQMKDFLDTVMNEEDSVMYSPSVMRNNQYLVIISTTLASRTAAQAGANYDTAMKKADTFIQKVDSAQSIRELVDIHKHMLLDFAKLVADSRIGKPASSLYIKVEGFITENLYEKITTADIASALQMSRTYLSAHFKNETGKNLADFINELKIDEAKRLLVSTDKSIIWIANSLCFSSQSYFTEVFKKIVGCSPKEFRDNPLFPLKRKQ